MKVRTCTHTEHTPSYMHTFTCMYLCTPHICAHTHAHAHANTYTYMQTHSHTCTHPHHNTHLNLCIRTSTHPHLYRWTLICTCSHTHAQMSVRVHYYTHNTQMHYFGNRIKPTYEFFSQWLKLSHHIVSLSPNL